MSVVKRTIIVCTTKKALDGVTRRQDCLLDSRLGHAPGLWVWSQVRARTLGKAAKGRFSPSLSPSLSL